MGDRTTCTLGILRTNLEEVLAIFAAAKHPFHIMYTGEFDSSPIVQAEFPEVNYANLWCAETLVAAGIPYNWAWSDGMSYDAGEKFVRFDKNGDLNVVEVAACDEDTIPIDLLVKNLNNYTDLRDAIIEHIFKNEVEPLSAIHAENGKIYKLKHLLTT